jgi:hypothetical protein
MSVQPSFLLLDAPGNGSEAGLKVDGWHDHREFLDFDR